MAKLKKCKDCKTEISKKAKTCPSCGAPQGPKHYSLGKLILVSTLIGFIWILIDSDGSSPGLNPTQMAEKYVVNNVTPVNVTAPNISADDESKLIAWLIKDNKLVTAASLDGNVIKVRVAADGTPMHGYAAAMCISADDIIKAKGMRVEVISTNGTKQLGYNTCY